MRKTIGMLCVILLLAGMAWAQSDLSLAELARKVRAERAKKDLSRVPLYTNDNIPRATTLGPSAAPLMTATGEAIAEGEGEAAAGEKPAAEKEKKEECGESCWKDKFRTQREKIRGAERELDILQREYNLARVQYFQDPNQAMREQYSGTTAGGRELGSLLQRINDKKTEIERFKRELSALEDELRKAGGQPGWARE